MGDYARILRFSPCLKWAVASEARTLELDKLCGLTLFLCKSETVLWGRTMVVPALQGCGEVQCNHNSVTLEGGVCVPRGNTRRVGSRGADSLWQLSGKSLFLNMQDVLWGTVLNLYDILGLNGSHLGRNFQDRGWGLFGQRPWSPWGTHSHPAL